MTKDKKRGNPILKGLSSVMKKEGFIKRSNNWYLRTKETVLVVNIQSDYSYRYINFGVWIRKLANKEYIESFKEYKTALNPEYPRHFQCHIYFRPVHFPEKIKDLAEAVFDLEDSTMSDEEREKYIIEWMSKYEMPVLKQCVTIKGVVKALKEKKFEKALVHWKANKLME